MKRAARGFALALIVLAATGGLAGKSPDTGVIRLATPAPSSETPDGETPPEIGEPRKGFDYASFEARLESLWFQRKTFLASGRDEDAVRELERIRGFCAEEGVRRLEAVAGALVAEAARLLEQGRYAGALEALRYAELFDPGRPQVRRARAAVYWESGRGMLSAALELGASMRAALERSIERLDVLHRVAFLLVLAVIGALIVFSVVMLVRYQVAVRHETEEWMYARTGDRWSTLAGWALLGLPLVLWFGAGWVALYWIVITFRFMRSGERAAALALLAGLALAAPAYRTGVALYGTTADPAVRTTLASAGGEYDPDRIVRLRQLVDGHPEDPVYRFLLAGLYKNGRYFEEAFREYKEALTRSPSMVQAWVNIGNIYYTTGQYGEAIAHYRRALDVDEDTFLAWFNLHLAQSEAFRFQEAETSLERARQIEPDRVAELLSGARELGDRLSVQDATLAMTSVWEAALGGRHGIPLASGGSRELFAGISRASDPLGLAALAAVVACIGLLVWNRDNPPARLCIRCGRPFCHHCKSSREAHEYCSQCLHLYVLGDGLAPGTKSRKLYQVERHERLTRRSRRLASLLLPGSRQLLDGRAIVGLVLMVGWLAALLACQPAILGPVERLSGADLQLDLAESLSVPERFDVQPLAAVGVVGLPVIWVAGNLRRRRREV